MTINLKQMSIKELEKLRMDIDKALAAARAKALREARKAAQALADEYGVTLAEITGGAETAQPKGKGKARAAGRKAGKPKYANPDDPKRTWTGKGRQPDWFKAAIAAGKSPDDMAI